MLIIAQSHTALLVLTIAQVINELMSTTSTPIMKAPPPHFILFLHLLLLLSVDTTAVRVVPWGSL